MDERVSTFRLPTSSTGAALACVILCALHVSLTCVRAARRRSGRGAAVAQAARLLALL